VLCRAPVGLLIAVLKWVVCLVAGPVLGGAAGLGVAWGAGVYSRWKHPEDPSAFSASDIVVGTIPLGVLLGLAVGVYCAIRWVR
jgi:hypothetical protein